VLTIDGSQGEGGGQVLRTSLALSLVTGTPFRIERIRAARKTPGLLRQHLTAVNAARDIGRAEVDGAAIGSPELAFRPRAVHAGTYTFAVGTAGSASLVLQTVLPPLLVAGTTSTLTLEGGTHNPSAPPFDFLARVFLPLLRRMGARVDAELERYGFYPAGGGRFTVRIDGGAKLAPLSLLERGAVRRRRAWALVSDLPPRIAERELRTVQEQLGWAPEELEVVALTSASGRTRGPGNVVMLEIESEHVTELFTAFGARGVRAEAVAERAVAETRRYLAAAVPVGEHLADQLLVPLALGPGGAFRTLPLTPHATTSMDVIRAFLGTEFSQTALRSGGIVVEVPPRAAR
jgi:RNA 3'-terminal phosphate cyclase (ATP)